MNLFRWRRKKKSQLPSPPKVWIWKGPNSVIRFFFKEILDTSEIFGVRAEAFTLPFSVLAEVYKVRVYNSYLAVQCRQSDEIDAAALAQEVEAIGLRILSRRFGWGDNLQVAYIHNDRELTEIKEQEGLGFYTWLLGVG